MDVIKQAKIRKDYTGHRSGKLTVIRYLHTKNDHSEWLCQCDCGGSKVVNSSNLINGRVVSCGCRRRDREFNAFRGIGDLGKDHWTTIADHARRRGHEFNIQIEYGWQLFLDQAGKCALSGLPIKLASLKSKEKTASLDRIDSAKGYIKGNVQWVHKDVNKMKNTLNQDYFVKMCKLIGSYKETGEEFN